MKKCSVCDQTYTDDNLNFCLNDGGTLQKVSDDAPPTVFMNQARTTAPNWAEANQSNPWGSQPGGNLPGAWGNSSMSQTPPAYMSPSMQPVGRNQTLPTVSLVLGILSLVLCFCFGGIPLGLGAAVTGYLGMSNANSNPQIYGGRGMAIAGMVCGVVSVVASILWFISAAIGKH